MPINVQKAPGELTDITIDWTTRQLGSDTISTSNWSVAPAGLTIATNPAPSKTQTTTTAWLSGGIADQVYTVTNTVTTAGGRTYQQEVTCFVYQ